MDKGLKIIAIEPLKGCYQKHIKVLSRNTKYYLYNDYKIDENDNVEDTHSIAGQLYSDEDDKLQINISAIVGKNGTGKSTLIELLLMAINNLSFALSIHKKTINTVSLKPVVGLNVAIYFFSDKMYKLTIKRNYITIKEIGEDNNRFLLHLIYKNNKSITTKNTDIKPHGSYIEDDFNLSQFFYTIGTNYSHYALNSKDYGDWIHNVFHKNDAYQAPLVVNPYRYEGNIDINNENYLVKSRLLAYLLMGKSEYLELTEKQKAEYARFTLNKEKYKNVYTIGSGNQEKEVSFDQFFKKNNKDQLLKIIRSVFKLKKTTSYYKDDLELYIIKKLVSIARTYSKYLKYFDNTKGEFFFEGENNFNKFLIEISSINSHITFKLNQAINFLKNKTFDNLDCKTDKSFSIPFTKLSEEILKKCDKKDIINNIPPAIFDFDIEFEKNTENGIDENEASTFNALSSGEKQKIYTLYSTLYHITNINSVDSSLQQYKNVNLIFEEVELYFHPEMQRDWISYLLSRIKSLKFENINSINICFVTHSPFILSDIPNQNILFLKVDKQTNKAVPVKSNTLTFGQNIHTLLSNSFFLENGTIGKFAYEKIEEIVKFHEGVMNEEIDNVNLELKIEHFNEIIESIGEDVIRNILKNHMNEVELKLYGLEKFNTKRIEKLEKEIERLKSK